MTDQPLLSDLCKICTNNPPKYCCPRCSSLTCSLPCYTRHKAWSQCSGIRNPAAYVKISALATPAGIDRDFNFLTGIERAFGKGESEAEGRGISLEDGGGAGVVQGSNLQRRIGEVGVRVERMPRGMSRQRGNKTQWHGKHKCISWTVEWIHPDGSRENGQCREDLRIGDVYAQLLADKQPSKKRKRGTEVKSERPVKNATAKKGEKSIMDDGALSTKSEDADRVDDNDESKARLRFELDPIAETVDVKGDTTESHPPEEHMVDHSPIKHETVEEPLVASSQPPPLQQESPPLPPPPTLHFYLHKPLTASKLPVLIPLPANTTLSSALAHRTVIEYPTIYALHESVAELPASRFVVEMPKIQEVDVLMPKSGDVEGGVEIDDGDGVKDEDEEEQVMCEIKEEYDTGTAEVKGTFEEANVLELLQRDVQNLSKAI